MTGAAQGEIGLERYGPVEIRRELEGTNALLTAINQEVWASNADVLFKTKWRDLYRDWLEFYQGKLGFTGIISHLRDSTFDRAAAYRREALKFRYALIKAASLQAASPPVAPAPETGNRLPKIPEVPEMVMPAIPPFPWRAVVYGGAAVVGGILLIRIVSPRSGRP